MQNSYFPKYDLASRIEHTKFDSGMGGIMPKSIRLEGVEAPETQNFKQVFTGVIENLNAQMEAPDNLLKDVMMGNRPKTESLCANRQVVISKKCSITTFTH